MQGDCELEIFYQMLRLALCNSYGFLALPQLKSAKYYIFRMGDSRNFDEFRT